MNTYAMQVELHFQSESPNDHRFEDFLEELKQLADRHGISFGDYQSMRLKASDYNINSCASCGHITVDTRCVKAGDENMLPDFWFNIRRGNMDSGSLICTHCRPTASAT